MNTFNDSNYVILGLAEQASNPELTTPPDTLGKWLERTKSVNFVKGEFAENSLNLNYLKESNIWKKKNEEIQKASKGLDEEIRGLEKKKAPLKERLNEKKTREMNLKKLYLS